MCSSIYILKSILYSVFFLNFTEKSCTAESCTDIKKNLGGSA